MTVAPAARVFVFSFLLDASSWTHLLGLVVRVTLVAGGGVGHPTHHTVRVSTRAHKGAHSHSLLVPYLTGRLEIVTTVTPQLSRSIDIVRETLVPSTHRVAWIRGWALGTRKLPPMPLSRHH